MPGLGSFFDAANAYMANSTGSGRTLDGPAWI